MGSRNEAIAMKRILGRGSTRCLMCDKTSECTVMIDEDVIVGIKLLFGGTDQVNFVIFVNVTKRN